MYSKSQIKNVLEVTWVLDFFFTINLLILKFPNTVEMVKRLVRTITIVSCQLQVLTQQRVEFRTIVKGGGHWMEDYKKWHHIKGNKTFLLNIHFIPT